MSATKIILKRSSILGKRPNSQVLEPGELALNTNSQQPGVFFEVDTGDIVKAGPTAVGPASPVTYPELGESWFNTFRGDLQIGTVEEAIKVWRSVASPYLGGGGRVLFVAPEFPYANDSLANNGETLPYQSLNRAILEASKRYIQFVSSGLGLSEEVGSFTIYYASSRLTAYNAPGKTLENFTLKFSDEYAAPSYNDLLQFNTPEGAIIVPNGITIQALDYKKCEISPAYVPAYRHPAWPATDQNINQPLSSILKLSGNSYLNNFTFTDKISERRVYKITARVDSDIAIFHSTRPHGLGNNDRVYVNYTSNESDLNRSFTAGWYYAVPYNQFTFSLTEIPAPEELIPDNLFVTYSSLVYPGSTNRISLTVSNQLTSAHRLNTWSQASRKEIADYYVKVQHAYAEYFGGRVIPGEDLISAGDYIIVAPTDAPFPGNISTNSTRNSSAYLEQITVRSSYGMCGGSVDGDKIDGFESVILNACTVVSLQLDPAAYEVYASLYNPDIKKSEMKWWPLAQATFLTLPENEKPDKIENLSVEQQLAYLNATRIENIRYYYEHLKNEDGGSYGIVDINNDFRHYGFRALNGAYIQAQSIYTIGCAVGAWALNGGYINLTNSTSNFGSVAFKAEGFRGINTLGGAYANAKNFLIEGLNVPLALTQNQAEDNENKRILSLGGKITQVTYEEDNPDIQLLYLSNQFLPCYILPYSLKPGTAVWVTSRNCTYRAFLATDGGPTVKLNDPGNCTFAILRVRAWDSTIPTDPDIVPHLDIPYIRRFNDPREAADRVYSFYLTNTSPTALAPTVGSVVRLNQETQGLGMSTYIPNVQLDPGSLGGWGRVFSVASVATMNVGTSPNFNYVVGDVTQSNRYLITVTSVDTAKPWAQEFNYAQGSYSTFLNRNWYAAENNVWDYMYYDTPFSSTIGPEKLAPGEMCSPYVVTSTLDKQDLVKNTFQGSFAADPLADVYPDQSYFRGSTVPYTEYALQDYFDEDDSSNSLGLCLKDVATSSITALLTPINSSSTIQTEREMGPDQLYRPAIVELSVLSSAAIPNPKQTVSILRVSNGNIPGVYEYLRVVSLLGTTIKAIRLNRNNSFYPSPSSPSNPNVPPEWPIGSILAVCETNSTPSPLTYDPAWSITKSSMLRFFEVMGYNLGGMLGLLQPRYWGERLIPLSETFPPMAPIAGYARQPGAWPIEFNQPSTIIANNQIWSNCGYPLYSQGLPRYKTAEIPRKLSFDFLCTTLWGGRLTVQGTNDNGELVLFGPQREALTSQYYQQQSPLINRGNQQLYEEQPYVEFPGQVVVYSVDNFSNQFDGGQTTFELKRNGFDIPPNQISPDSLIVQLGAIVQKPGVDYVLGSGNITFTSAPLQSSHCNVRVVTSEDSEKTLKVVKLSIVPPDPEQPDVIFDGTTSVFTLRANYNISDLVITQDNTFVILGGVEQLPGAAYVMNRINSTDIELSFSEAPAVGTTVDIRAICSNSYWSSQGVFPVAVYSMDSIGPFDGVQNTFDLKYGGQFVNPQLVSAQNLIISLGGAIQLPGTAYTVNNGKVIFSEPPRAGAHSNLRVITNSEFLPCINNRGVVEGFMSWGPSILSDILYEIETIKGRLG